MSLGGKPLTDNSQDGCDPDPDHDNDPTNNNTPTPIIDPEEIPAMSLCLLAGLATMLGLIAIRRAS
jgi:hypothetical protein